MTKTIAALAAVCACGAPTVAAAATKTHPIGLSVSYPDEWKTEVDGDSLTIQSPGGAVVVLCLLFEATNLDAAKAQLDSQLRHIVDDLKVVVAPREITVNGLRGITATGTGVIKGTPANWEVSLYVYQRKTLMLVALADSSKYGFVVAQIASIFQGVKVTGGGTPAAEPPPPEPQPPSKRPGPSKRAKHR